MNSLTDVIGVLSLANLLPRINLCSQSASDDVAAHVFHAVNKQLFQLLLLHGIVHSSCLVLNYLTFQLLVGRRHGLNLFVVISFEHLNVSSDLSLDSFIVNSRVKHDLQELLKLQVFSGNPAVSTRWSNCRFVSLVLLRMAVLGALSTRSIIRHFTI